MFLADNQSVEYQSGASRLMNNICMAVCVAPLLLLGMILMIGWNEQRAVCDQRAISSGLDVVVQVHCQDPPSTGMGELVMFSCDIDTNSLKSMPLSGYFAGSFHTGVGIKVDSEMYQCVETDNSRTEKTQGGGTRTIHTYTYSKEWKSDEVDSSLFHAIGSENWRRNCGSSNPHWDTQVPRSGSDFVSSMKVGPFTTTMTDRVPLTSPITDISRPAGWSSRGPGSFYRSSGGSESFATIGDYRVTFYSNDPRQLQTTVLGQNMDSQGNIGKWVAPSSWLCSGFSLADLRMGTWGKDALFQELAAEANTLTWILRVVGFVVMWWAFCLCFGPLEVAADCIPCVGPCIGDAVSAVACFVSFLPACGCCLGVAGVVWVAMRPLVGIPCILAFLFITGGYGSYIAKKRKQRSGGQVLLPGYGASASAPPMTYQQQSLQPQG